MKASKLSMLLSRFLTERKEYKEKQTEKFKGHISSNFIYCNNYINIIYNAGKECYAGRKTSDIGDMRNFISKRVQEGHESILEHGNFVIGFIIPNTYYKDIVEFLEVCTFLKTKINVIDDNTYIVLGGSPRAYKHVIRFIKSSNNVLLGELLDILYIHTDSCLYTDLINDGIMKDEKAFLNESTSKALVNESYREVCSPQIEYNILNVDNCNYIVQDKSDNISVYDILKDKYMLTKKDMLDLFTITVYFKNMSRIISQQLTRHRNAITQQSQRYINYEHGVFNSPVKFKEGTYDSNLKYTVELLGNKVTGNLQELGDGLVGVYKQLSSGPNKLIKEDARAYLPNNVATSLYITFTFTNFIHFLALRSERHAQAEIRLFALSFIKDIEKYSIDILGFKSFDQLKNTIQPLYKYKEETTNEYNDIDEIID